MIGLEFICKLYEMEYKEVAEKLNITPQTINSWLRGKRPIPKNRALQLSELFNDLDSNLFGKELTDDEIEDIDMICKNEKVIEILEEKKNSNINGEFGFQEFNDLILSLYRKMMFDGKDNKLIYRKMDLLKNFLYLIIDDIEEKTVLWEVLDLLSQNIEEFNQDLFELVDRYIDYL